MPPAAQEGGHVGEEGEGLGLEVELGGFHQDHCVHRKVTEGKTAALKLDTGLKPAVSAWLKSDSASVAVK